MSAGEYRLISTKKRFTIILKSVKKRKITQIIQSGAAYIWAITALNRYSKFARVKRAGNLINNTRLCSTIWLWKTNICLAYMQMFPSLKRRAMNSKMSNFAERFRRMIYRCHFDSCNVLFYYNRLRYKKSYFVLSYLMWPYHYSAYVCLSLQWCHMSIMLFKITGHSSVFQQFFFG